MAIQIMVGFEVVTVVYLFYTLVENCKLVIMSIPGDGVRAAG